MIRPALRGRHRVLRSPHEKVAREVHAVQPESGAPSDLHVDDGQRDGNAGATVEHLVEAAVARVLVLIAVADEPLVGEQVLIEPLDSAEERDVAGLLDVASICRPAVSPIASRRAR